MDIDKQANTSLFFNSESNVPSVEKISASYHFVYTVQFHGFFFELDSQFQASVNLSVLL